MKQVGITNYNKVNCADSSFWSSVAGKALPATMYMLVYSIYTFVFANDMNVNLIRLTYGVYYAMTAWFIICSIKYCKSSRFLKYLTLLTTIFIIYGVFLYINGTTGWKEHREPSSFLLDYIPRILPIFAFYYFGIRGIINERWFRIFFILFFLDVLLLYLSQQRSLIENSLNGETDFVNNSGYMVASLLPLICFFDKSKIVQFVLAAVIIGFTIICFKRGAILCAGLSFIYFLYISLKTTKRRNKILIVILFVASLFVLSGFIENLMDSNDFFFNRVIETKEGKSSERDNIYGFFLNYFFSADNGFNFIWGNGAYGTTKIYGTEAHNDWLEVAIDFGIVGLILFMSFWLSIYKNIRYSKKYISTALFSAVVMCVIFIFSRTFFSMSIGDLSFVSASVLGCGMGLIDRERKGLNGRKLK